MNKIDQAIKRAKQLAEHGRTPKGHRHAAFLVQRGNRIAVTQYRPKDGVYMMRIPREQRRRQPDDCDTM